MTTTPRHFAEKHPAEVEFRAIDWTDALPEGDTIASSAWSATPVGLVLTAPAIDGAITSTRIAGGTAGVAYSITNTVQTTQGLTLVETVGQWVLEP